MIWGESLPLAGPLPNLRSPHLGGPLCIILSKLLILSDEQSLRPQPNHPVVPRISLSLPSPPLEKWRLGHHRPAEAAGDSCAWRELLRRIASIRVAMCRANSSLWNLMPLRNCISNFSFLLLIFLLLISSMTSMY